MAGPTPKKQEPLQNSLVNAMTPETQEIVNTEETDSTKETLEPESSITELQSAFPSLLLLTRSTTTPVPLPRWTCAVKIFDFPRELRDLIYYHAVFRLRGLHYTAHVRRAYFWYSKDRTTSIANLLCASKQVYSEAYEVFCRYNTIILGEGNTTREHYNKPLTGLLRLFPGIPARHLTIVRLSYNDEMSRPSGQWGYAPSHGPLGDATEGYHKKQFPSQTFIDILRDADVLTGFFDRLQVFEVCWSMRSWNMLEGDEETEKRIGRCVEWMKTCTQTCYVVPWEGVRFFIGEGEQGRVLNEAYQRLVREEKGKEEIEDSGRVWLEGLGDEKKAKKKKKSGRRKLIKS